jgi:fumarate hydratase class I
VNLDTLTREEVASWKPGDTLLLNGKLLTGRDAAHKRIADHHARGERLPEGVDFRNRVIYYVGPVDPVRDEVVGARRSHHRDAHGQVHAAHARASRPDRDDRQGRARPGDVEAIRKFGAAYLMAVGGAAYLVSKAIRASRVVAFGDLGMEAIYEFDVKDMPVTVAVDARGKSVHHTAPRSGRRASARFRYSE